MARKQWTLHKTDNWNMINLLLEGSKYVISEISSTYGENTIEFTHRGELRHWAESYFSPGKWKGTEEERQHALEIIKKV